MRLFLAPMEGISDFIVRDLLSRISGGAMDVCVTEFIRVAHQPLHPNVLLRECPELSAGGKTPCGTTVLVPSPRTSRPSWARRGSISTSVVPRKK
jgi:tRNA-dihydrouridine synthase C